MAKKYIPCTTVEECHMAHAAGVIYWYSDDFATWFQYPAGAPSYSPTLLWEQLANWKPSVLVDTDEE